MGGDCKDAVMHSLQVIDLHFGGGEHAVGVYLVDTTTAPRSSTAVRRRPCRARGGLAERARARRRSAICCSRTSTSTMPARPARSSAESGADGLGLARSARRTSSTRRGSSAPRGGCTAISSTRSGASSRPCPRRTSARRPATCSAGRRSRPSGTPRTTSATSATGRCSPATPAGVRMPGASTSSRSHPRRTSTSRRGMRRSRRSGGASRTGSRSIHFGVHEDVERAPRPARGRARPLGGSRRATGWSQDEFVAAARARRSAPTPTHYDQVAPFWQSWTGSSATGTGGRGATSR